MNQSIQLKQTSKDFYNFIKIKFMEKRKILETVGEIVMGLIGIAVGTLIIVTTVTFLYQMVAAIFD